MRFKFTFIIIFSFCIKINSQNTFPYIKSWGTYVGGCGTLIYDQNQYGNGLYLDSYKNIYVGGLTYLQSGYSASYYNQFVYNGGNNVTPGNSHNLYQAEFSQTGQFLKGGYTGIPSGGYNNLIGIDHNDNKFYVERLTSPTPNLATSGAWLEQIPVGNLTYLLSKYDVNNNLVWKTYIPNPMNIYFTVKFDSEGNIYLMGRTGESISNLTTPGSFQQNYQAISSTEYVNSFLVKLNSAGQRVWATYLSRQIWDFEIYNSSIYLITLASNTPTPEYISSGTFQPSIFGRNLILKLSTLTGLKEWGTYFGSLNAGYPESTNDIEVNETGIYISGLASSATGSTYYATVGSFKTAVTGTSDFYLTKFDFSGNRVWGTYFGSDGSESINAFPNLSLFGDRIVTTGKQYGFTNNIATTGAYITTPANTSSTATNSFFVEFDSSGSRKYCSYFLERGNLIFNDNHSPVFLNDGSLLIWGYTGITTGVGTPNGAFPTMINPFPSIPFGYIVRFNLKNPLSTSEVLKVEDLILYDNPNNGNFYLKGNILEKQKTSIKITDMSGRLIAKQKLEKSKINLIQMKGKLSAGNYLLQILSEKEEQIKVFKMAVR